MRGRVSAVNAIFIGSSNEVGGLESGVVAQAFGPVASVVSGGIGTLLVVLLWSLIFPTLRRFGMLTSVDRSAMVADYAARVQQRRTKRNREQERVRSQYEMDTNERLRNYKAPNAYGKRPSGIPPR
jgi:hypothetical protein